MKKLRICFISIFLLILAIFFVKTVTSNREVSDVEKRELVTFPEINKSSIFSSDTYTQLTYAFNDQLFNRDFLVKTYYLFQFQRYLGDVVKGEDNEMFSSVQTGVDYDEYKEDLLDASSYVNDVARELQENDIQFIFLSIPRKDAYLEEYLPSTYTSSRDIYEYGVNILKENLDSSIIFIDALDVFEENKGDNHYYFKTDHHINVRGGELLYKEIMNIVNQKYNAPIYELEDLYDIHSVTVNGSFNKQVGQGVKLSQEELYLTLKEDISYRRYENDTLSNLSVWSKGTEYGNVFMSGDRAYTRIETNRKDLPNIMYVGSSFTNVLEALTIPSVNRMVSIDYRDNKSGTSILEYAKKYDIQYVVFVPSQSNNALNPSAIRLHIGANNES